MLKNNVDIITNQVDAFLKTLESQANSYVKALHSIDEQLNKNLAGVFAIIMDLHTKVNALRRGVERVEVLRDSSVKAMRSIIEKRREKLIKLIDDILTSLDDLENSVNEVKNKIKNYAIRAEVKGPGLFVVNIPIIMIRVNGRQYKRIIAPGVTARDIEVTEKEPRMSHQLYNDVLKLSIREGGLLRRLFLKHSIRIAR